MISAIYWICAGAQAAHRPLWYDELETWHIAQLPTVSAMWEANRGGVDNNMLLSHLAVRGSQSLLGPAFRCYAASGS